MELEICLFNSLRKYSADGMIFRMSVPQGTTTANLIDSPSRCSSLMSMR